MFSKKNRAIAKPNHLCLDSRPYNTSSPSLARHNESGTTLPRRIVSGTLFTLSIMQEGLHAKREKPVSSRLVSVSLAAFLLLTMTSSHASRDLQHSIPMGLLACIPGLVSQLESIQCPSCPVILENATFYQRHLRKHTENRPFECVTCHETFKLVGLLTRHKAKHARPRFKCSNCSKQFYRTDLYAKHRGRCLALIETVQSQVPPRGDKDLLPEKSIPPSTEDASTSLMATIRHQNGTIQREDQPVALTPAPVMPLQPSPAPSHKTPPPTHRTTETSTERSLFHHSDFEADESRLSLTNRMTASQSPTRSDSFDPLAPHRRQLNEASPDSIKLLGNLHASRNDAMIPSLESSTAHVIVYQLYCNSTMLYNGLEETHCVMLRSEDCFLSLIQETLSAHGRLLSHVGYDEDWVRPFEIRSPFWVA